MSSDEARCAVVQHAPALRQPLVPGFEGNILRCAYKPLHMCHSAVQVESVQGSPWEPEHVHSAVEHSHVQLSPAQVTGEADTVGSNSMQIASARHENGN